MGGVSKTTPTPYPCGIFCGLLSLKMRGLFVRIRVRSRPRQEVNPIWGVGVGWGRRGLEFRAKKSRPEGRRVLLVRRIIGI
jgi:hypothetical protein